MFFNGEEFPELISAPSLPATTLTEECYQQMFESVYNLKYAPELPATTLAESCYNSMFHSCTSLITPAVLGDGTTQLTGVKNCCNSMYYDCTSLNLYTTSTSHTPFYNAMTYSDTATDANYRSTYKMFYNCKIDNVTSTDNYIAASTQLYY